MNFSHPLFGLREHRRNLARREASGDNLWAKHLDQEVRNKLLHTIVVLGQEHQNAIDQSRQFNNYSDVVDHVVRTACFHSGIAALPHQRSWPASENELLKTIVDNHTDKSLVFSLIEAIWQTTAPFSYRRTGPGRPNDPRLQFSTNIRTILDDHRVAFDFVEGQFIPRGDQTMHREVIVPTLTLLSDRKNLDIAESKYTDALKSIQDKRFDDAITDTSAALEATLGALGCSGNTLGKKLSHAMKLGLLAQYDKKLVDWLSSDRGTRGDAHPEGSGATRADAWLSAHIAGALILCLAEGEGRAAPTD